MRLTHLVPLAALATSATAQASSAVFEPHDFDPTAALQDLGVNVSTLPEPNNSTLTARSPFSPCALAVSCSGFMILSMS
jgi:hypothetical protein